MTLKRIALAFPGDMSIQEMLEYVILAEKRGYESVWMAEDYFLRDGFTPLAAFAAVTEKIGIGTAIVSIYTRHPAINAISIATIDEYSNGRARLGLGASARLPVEVNMGIPYKQHLTRMREHVEITRRILRGETVNYEGKIYRIENLKLGFKPKSEKIPIYIGATGPHMLQLAGEIGDGVIFNAFSSPKYIRDFALEQVKIGAERAGRSLKDLDISAHVVYSVSKNPEVARTHVKRLLALYFANPEVSKPLAMHSGVDIDDDLFKKIMKARLEWKSEEMANLIPDSFVDIFAVAGSPDEARQKLQQFYEAGIDFPQLYLLGDKDDKRISIETAVE